jgi:ATP-dependent RNA helicase DeaD
MTDVEYLQLTPSVAHALAELGWSAEDPRVRDAAPTAARGHNLAVVSPPAAAYGAPALAGLAARLQKREVPGPAVLLCPEAELEEWGMLATTLLGRSDVRVEVARGASRAGKRLQGGAIDLLVASSLSIAALNARGAIKGERIGAVVLGGPERWPDLQLLVPLMADVPQDHQRIILAGAPERAAELTGRYARKALVLGAPADVPPKAQGPVRTVTVGWNRRIAALAELVELLDPASLVVWTADRSRHGAIAATLPGADGSVRVVIGDAPHAEVVIAFDPPDPPRLGQLLQAGDVVLLAPPGTEPYIDRIASPRRPLRLPGPLDVAADSAAQRRGAIARAIETGRSEQALLSLAPLFERFDATAVAAAVYDLWVEAGSRPAAVPQAAPAPAVAATAKVFVGVGKSDGATPSDLVAVLTKEVRVARDKIGRIELRDAYSLVELPAQDAERIASALNGATIRRKRVVARIDRGRARPVAPTPRQRR